MSSKIALIILAAFLIINFVLYIGELGGHLPCSIQSGNNFWD